MRRQGGHRADLMARPWHGASLDAGRDPSGGHSWHRV
jgi:hypothetical protein